MTDIKREPELTHSSWCGYIYTGESDVTHAHHPGFTYLTVHDLCENTKGFLYIGLLFSGQKAVVLQDAELCVSTRRLRL